MLQTNTLRVWLPLDFMTFDLMQNRGGFSKILLKHPKIDFIYYSLIFFFLPKDVSHLVQ